MRLILIIVVTVGCFTNRLNTNPIALFNTIQADTRPFIGVVEESGIRFYTLLPTDELELKGSLPTQFHLGKSDNSDNWWIRYEKNLVVSPDGKLIAFPAQQREMGALFIYDWGQNILQQIALPTPHLDVVWSPNSAAILLTPCCEDSAFPVPDDIYVYDLSLGQFFDQPSGSQFRWLPDSTHLIYNRMGRFYRVPYQDSANLILLVDTYEQIPVGAERNICMPTLSAFDQRIYYTVGCAVGGDTSEEYLLSVGLQNNDNRLEISTSFPEFYPTEREVRVRDIQASRNGVYVIFDSQDGSDQARLRILLLHDPGQFELVHEDFFDHGVHRAALSLNQQEIMLRGFPNYDGTLEIVSLQDGTVLVSPEVVSTGVCDAVWVDDETILYTITTLEGLCSAAYGSAPLRVWVLDVSTKTTRQLVDDQLGSGWILTTTLS